MDGFMFGSCCGHNLSDNAPRPSTTFGPAAKPIAPYKSKPTKTSSKYGTFQTILRPNGNGMLVIRQPSNDQHSLKTKTTSRQPSTISHAWNNFHDSLDAELTGAASVVASKFLRFCTAKVVSMLLFIRFLDQSPLDSHNRTQLRDKNKVTVG